MGDFGEIVMAMGLHHRVEIGRLALRTAVHSGYSHKRPRLALLQRYEQELMKGECTLLVHGDGKMERIVTLVVFRVVRADGAVFVQLGKVTAHGVLPECALPSSNFVEAEQSSDEVHVILGAVLAPLQPIVDVTSIERRIEMEETAAVRTKFIITECRAMVNEESGDVLTGFVVGGKPEMGHTEHMQSTETGERSWSVPLPHVQQTPNIVPERLLRMLQQRKVYGFNTGAEVSVYTWMSDPEFDSFRNNESRAILGSFLTSLGLSPSAFKRQTAKTTARASQGVCPQLDVSDPGTHREAGRDDTTSTL